MNMTMVSPTPENGGEDLEELTPEAVEGPEPAEAVIPEESLPSAQTDPDEFSPTGSFTWKIENFSKIQEKKLYSEMFTVGGHQWRILIFPRGNQPNYFSIYLDVGDAPLTGWSRTAFFTLNIVNHKDKSETIKKDCQHRFAPKERDWGFTSYIPLAELTDPSRGYLDNDTLIVEADITVRPEDVRYNSKKATGFVGLKNQGATCYMNSLLQTLFHLPSFRKAVYHMPTTEEDLPQSSIPLALQALFYKLQYSETSVPTNDLTKSFGWDTYDSFMQHDVQELNRVLCEKLEQKMKSTVVEGTIERLFEGHHMNYIECINVDYKSTRKESFYDLQLDVKGCKNVYDSFDKYVEVEMLDGDNKYHAEQHGLQDAKKGVLFIDFPPVLQLQLKRFEYDFMRDVMVKINDRYEFPLELDLDREDGKYLSPDADRLVQNKYTLHSVLVHSGGVHGGHYYAYIRPTLSNQWYKFDDERVTKEDMQRALEEQYGGDDDNANNMNPQFRFAKFSNAYMLVYIRVSDIDKVFCQVDDKDIARHLLERMKQEQEDIARRKKEQAESHLYVNVRIARDEDLRQQIGKDNFVFDLVDHYRSEVQNFRVPKGQLFLDLMKQVEEELEIPMQHQRYWFWVRRENYSYRPGNPLVESDIESQVGMILQEHREGSLGKDLKLYLEVVTPEKRDISKEHLVFVKFYDPQEEQLSYLGTIYVKPTDCLEDHLTQIKELAEVDMEEALDVYEELEYDPKVVCQLLDPDKTFHDLNTKDGDIFVVQKSVPNDSQLRHPNVPSYFSYIKYRQVVHFRALDKPKEDAHIIELSKLSPYDEVVSLLATQLGLSDPSLVRLTAQNVYTQAPKPSPLKYRCFEHLKDVLYFQQQSTNVLYFDIVDLPLPQLEELKSLRVSFCNPKAEEEEVLSLRLPRKSNIEDLAQLIKEKMKLDSPETSVRIMEVYNSKVYKVFKEDESVDTINDQYWIIRAEEVSAEEKEELKAEDARLIQVVNYTKDSNASPFAFGNPFLLPLKPDTTLAQVKEKIKAKLQISAEDLNKLKFALVTTSKAEYIEEETVIGPFFQGKEAATVSDNAPCIGLEHTDPVLPRRPTPVQSRYSFEKPVKIHN